jgi:hypothetical protein
LGGIMLISDDIPALAWHHIHITVC